jgi:hypothetical protein
MKQNINFNFQSPSTFVFIVFHKHGVAKSCSSFKTCQNTTFNGLTLIGATSEVLKVRHLGTIEACSLFCCESAYFIEIPLKSLVFSKHFIQEG